MNAQMAGVFAGALAFFFRKLHNDTAVLGPVVDRLDDGAGLGALLFVKAGAFGFDTGEFFAAKVGTARYQGQ